MEIKNFNNSPCFAPSVSDFAPSVIKGEENPTFLEWGRNLVRKEREWDTTTIRRLCLRSVFNSAANAQAVLPKVKFTIIH
jgi:hypothetical protein